MGTDALEPERVALQQRKTDDFTEGRIAQIARELQLLQSNREVEVLKQRQNEDLFLSGVEPLRAEIVRLGNLSNLDSSNMKLVSIDRKALEPMQPIKPKKALVILLDLLLGGMLGVLIVLVRYFVAIRQGAVKITTAPGVVDTWTGPATKGKALPNDKH